MAAGSSMGVNINQTLALALPGACNVQTPPVSQCNSVDGPTTSPATSPMTSPADSSNEKPATPTTSVPSIPSGTGSKTVPTSGSTSDGSITRMPLHLTVFILFVAACSSAVIKF
ncbi:hypothetical protein F0562_021242 [Nyssa sinensis]|uniref:Bifunctional inhibitor/plant lipid transfer protein/seed storage helical domain-containing protein n=1 Tax=Nyssa sinensis TaxID=561372 RepID=A0A5J5BJJ6_9ASTE|nr:hypothetical protein F0562_021242 [Nyssa sinensis]